jgi:hypothetical protein
VVRAFLAKIMMGQPPQLLIDQRHQLLERLAVSSPPADEQLRNRTGRFLLQEDSDLPQSAGGERDLAASLSVPHFLVNGLKTRQLCVERSFRNKFL